MDLLTAILILTAIIWIPALLFAPFVIWTFVEGAWQWYANGLHWCNLTKKYLTPEQCRDNYRWHYGLDDWTEADEDGNLIYEDEK